VLSKSSPSGTSLLDDGKVRVLAAKALDNPDLRQLDLSHNAIGDR
jgi:hypothetical protein